MTINSPKGPEPLRERVLHALCDGYNEQHASSTKDTARPDEFVGEADAVMAVFEPEVERLTAEVELFRERDGLTRKALQHDGDGPLQFAALLVRQERDRLRVEVSRLREQLAPARLGAAIHQERADQLVIGLQRLLDKDREIENGPAPVSESVPATPQPELTCSEDCSAKAPECRCTEQSWHRTCCHVTPVADPLRASAPSEASQLQANSKQEQNLEVGSASTPPAGGDSDTTPTPRLRGCVERWPDCEEGSYHPSCCRFPKSCSCTIYNPANVTPEDLEPSPSSLPQEGGTDAPL